MTRLEIAPSLHAVVGAIYLISAFVGRETEGSGARDEIGENVQLPWDMIGINHDIVSA